jgi:triacylglycerol lipase
MRCRVKNTDTGESFADITDMYVKLVSELKELGL